MTLPTLLTHCGVYQAHVITSGLKAYSTSLGRRLADVCRLACGGHGYLLSSGIPEMFSILSASCTYEGDNTVLMLQVARSEIDLKIMRGRGGGYTQEFSKYTILVTSLNMCHFCTFNRMSCLLPNHKSLFNLNLPTCGIWVKYFRIPLCLCVYVHVCAYMSVCVHVCI